MKEERLMILNMVNEGKISAEDAAKLLEALKHPNYRYDYSFDTEEKLNKFSQSVDSFAKDFGERVEGLFKGAEPKFKKATKTVVERTATVINDISNSLNESLKKFEDCDCNCDNDCKCDDDCKCDCPEVKSEDEDQPKSN